MCVLAGLLAFSTLVEARPNGHSKKKSKTSHSSSKKKSHKSSSKSKSKSSSRKSKGRTSSKSSRSSVRFVEPPRQSLRLGVGDLSNVWLGGDQATIKINSSDPQLLEVEKAKIGFVARAMRPGQGWITVVQNGKPRKIDFSVKPYAAKLPSQLNAQVTGRPAIPGTVQGAVESVLKQQIDFAPLATLSTQFTNVPSLGAGVSASVPVKVTISAPGTVPRTGTITVKVTNIGLQAKSEDALWYSNDPERITKKANLFAAELEPQKSARLLYHHINDMRQPIIVRTMLVNDSDTETSVCITPGDSAPTIDPVGAGLRAGDLFLRAWMNDSAEIITLPPHSCVPVSCRRLKPASVISGLCSIRYINGTSKLLVRTDAITPTDLEPRWSSTLASSTPWREVGAMPIRTWDQTPYVISEHVYPVPYQTETAQYNVGGRFSVIRLGQKAIGRLDNSGRLDGNFGVVYDIGATITNPQKISTDVELVFEPSAGYSGGIFFVDDRYVITPKILPKSEARIARYRLYPGETRKVKIVTMPLSGSSYPATIFVRLIGSGSTSDIIDLTKSR